MGHQHIVGVFKADDHQGRERHKGYVMALQEAGYQYDPDMVVWFHTEDRQMKPVTSVVQMIKDQRKMDAVVCYNDQIAFSIIGGLHQIGVSIPEDLSITGYDNSMLAHQHPLSLTTIAHPQEKLGEMAGQLLLEKIQGGSDEDVQHIVGEEKKTGDIQSLDNSNVEVDIARNHLDEIEERNAVTIDLLKDVDVIKLNHAT